MAEASIPVDLFNPGQVFACLGFLEAADILLGDAEGAFDWSDEATTVFRLRAYVDRDPVTVVLDFLDSCEVRILVPQGSGLETSSKEVPTELVSCEEPFPFPTPATPATLPAILVGSVAGSEHRLTIDYWGDATRRDNVKFWGGSAGKSGAAFARDALKQVQGRCSKAASDPLNLSAEQSGSFRFDWRRDYIPIDLGFSLNNHSKISSLGYPLVELLAAIGVTHARPYRPDWRDKLRYRYCVTAGAEFTGDRSLKPLLDPMLLRAGLGGAELPFPQRRFHMSLDWPGQEGQARTITTVTEEGR